MPSRPADLTSLYRGHRFPPEVIAHAVWLYFRFHLSLRDVQDLLAERGIIVSHEAICQWCTKFGPTYPAGLRRRRARSGDKWHLDEVLLKINGKRHLSPAPARRRRSPAAKLGPNFEHQAWIVSWLTMMPRSASRS